MRPDRSSRQDGNTPLGSADSVMRLHVQRTLRGPSEAIPTTQGRRLPTVGRLPRRAGLAACGGLRSQCENRASAAPLQSRTFDSTRIPSYPKR